MDSFGNLIDEDGSSISNGYRNREFHAKAGWRLYFFLKADWDIPNLGPDLLRLKIYEANEDYMGMTLVGGLVTGLWAIVVAGTGIVLLVGVLLRIWVDHRDKLHET